MRRPRGSTRNSKLALALSVAALVVVPAAALGAAGDFAQPSTSPEATGSSPQGIVAANLNGDAHTDLAVANSVSDSVTILLNDGSGSGNFTATGTATPANNNPTDLVAANLGGDASTDLAIVNGADNTVTTLLGPTFSAAPGSPEGAGGGLPVSIAAANLNGDAYTDLAIGNNGLTPGTSNVTILLGSATGDFTPGGTETVGVNIGALHAIAPANLDGDADTDLAVVNRSVNHVVILLNDGAGDFTPAAGTSPEAVGSTPTAAAAADFNGDTNTDLAVANSNVDNVTILLGSPSGDFTPASPPTQPAGDIPEAIVAANLGGSASIDLAVTNVGTDNVTVLFGDGSGGFAPAGTSPETVGDGPISIAAANLGGTASIDLATANSFSANATILINELAPPVIPPDVKPPAQPPKKCKKGQKLKKGKCVKKKKRKKK